MNLSISSISSSVSGRGISTDELTVNDLPKKWADPKMYWMGSCLFIFEIIESKRDRSTVSISLPDKTSVFESPYLFSRMR